MMGEFMWKQTHLFPWIKNIWPSRHFNINSKANLHSSHHEIIKYKCDMRIWWRRAKPLSAGPELKLYSLNCMHRRCYVCSFTQERCSGCEWIFQATTPCTWDTCTHFDDAVKNVFMDDRWMLGCDLVEVDHQVNDLLGEGHIVHRHPVRLRKQRGIGISWGNRHYVIVVVIIDKDSMTHLTSCAGVNRLSFHFAELWRPDSKVHKGQELIKEVRIHVGEVLWTRNDFLKRMEGRGDSKDLVEARE